MSENKSLVVTINEQINVELADPKVAAAILATTFKGLDVVQMKQALMEGMIRGFTFKDFLEKNIYAIPFAGGYSLIVSIDFARKIGSRSGIVGKNKPEYVVEGGKIISCAVTVKKKIAAYVGDFTAEVYFSEYFKAGRNGKLSLWESKPRTMIAKVAEMHALRMACPEELAQSYVEEELDAENTPGFNSRLSVVEGDTLNMGKFLKDEEKNKEGKAGTEAGAEGGKA